MFQVLQQSWTDFLIFLASTFDPSTLLTFQSATQIEESRVESEIWKDNCEENEEDGHIEEEENILIFIDQSGHHYDFLISGKPSEKLVYEIKTHFYCFGPIHLKWPKSKCQILPPE